MLSDRRVQKFNDQISDNKKQVGGFSIDFTENGFIITLVLFEEIDNETVGYRPSFCFEGMDILDDVIGVVVSKAKLQRL